ncbi:HEAT repeat domain-containing protein [Methylophilus methylotrophus]|uniref:HEAT repeat domain-containing protein n=1 Tax=Methylophilus methylotrophus TaxID=17 RepID=UPI000375CBDF|nr:HEAT repeat domain-containing protein [Methylophilus methylotrophus]
MMFGSADTLVQLAIKTRDPYIAAAVHELATGIAKLELEALICGTRRTALAIARWEHTPASVLTALAGIHDDAIELRLDKNPGTSSGVLSNLYEDASKKGKSGLTKLIAQHLNSGTEVLKRIALHSNDVECLLALSKNTSANSKVLAALSERVSGSDIAVAIHKNIAQNISASAELLARIFDKSDVYTQTAILGHEHCPASLIAKSAASEEVLMMRVLARNRRVSKESLQRYADCDDAGVRAGVASNALTPVAIFRHLLRDKSELVRREVASRIDLSEEHIEALSSDADPWVRQRIARNPTTSLDVLYKLAVDEVADVRRAVARNTMSAVHLLNMLAEDKHAWVRSGVAYQANASQRILIKLADDKDVDVLSGVANNPNTPQTILKGLVRSTEADVRRGVILNKSATRNTLLPLLEDPYYLHRMLLVQNPHLQAQDKWSLRDDPDSQVRFSVYRWAANICLKMPDTFLVTK